jgi:tetratricopeptide (TPR) repeat protein
MASTQGLPRRVLVAGWLVAALAASGCAQVNTLKSKVVGPPANQTPATAPAAPATATPTDLSLTAIINEQLQMGRYAEGEKSLRRYVKQHPDDRLAQNLLRQLTVDPQQALGSSSHAYAVQSGDSYSTLAARFLGDGNQFLILARYNNSTNPSMLRAGQMLRLPASSKVAAAPAAVPDSNASPAVQARHLQDASLALLAQGRRDDAVARYDQALSLDPSLKPANADAEGLRTQVLNNYHQRAIVLYRDQKLDQAIALWDHVLAIDPGFEAATVYRTRALELKHRLKQI